MVGHEDGGFWLNEVFLFGKVDFNPSWQLVVVHFLRLKYNTVFLDGFVNLTALVNVFVL